MDMVRMVQNISLLLQRAQSKWTYIDLLSNENGIYKYGGRFGGTDRVINLGHPVASMVEHEKGGGAMNISSSHSKS